jgi:5-methylcytosine-specific restriction protein A
MTLNPLMLRERVVIPDRPQPTKAQKVRVWNRENGVCYLCGKPVALEGEGVRYDHREMREVSGDDSDANLFPTHERCHQDKTSNHDAPRIAKVRRQEKLTRPKVRKARGFAGWRKFNGEIVRRKP